MTSPIEQLLRVPGARYAARALADWVDLQYSQLVTQLEAIAPKTRGRLLDVGCGEKPFESIFRPHVDEYVGIEHEATFSSTQTAQRVSRPDHFYDGKTLPFAEKSFDTVMCIQVLEHTPHPQAVLNEMRRVTKDDGLVIVCVPFSFRLHEEPHDYFRYTPHGLRAMFGEAGLVMDGIWSQGDLWTVLGHKLNSYLAKRVARLDGVAQKMGKMGHEDATSVAPRYWTLPFVLPTMGTVSGMARVLDRALPDGSETLSYLAFGHPIAD